MRRYHIAADGTVRVRCRRCEQYLPLSEARSVTVTVPVTFFAYEGNAEDAPPPDVMATLQCEGWNIVTGTDDTGRKFVRVAGVVYRDEQRVPVGVTFEHLRCPKDEPQGEQARTQAAWKRMRQGRR